MKILGLTDEVTSCSCCGRTDLKCTVAIEREGEVVYYGRTCATRHTGKTSKEITAEAKRAEEERVKAARAELAASLEEQAYERAIAAENALGSFGSERLARIRPFAAASDAKKNEIKAKYNLTYF